MKDGAYMLYRAAGRLVGGGAEAVWLALLVLMPLAFSAYAESNFALPKAVWLRLLVPLGLVALAAVHTRSDGRDEIKVGGAWFAIGLAVLVSLASNLVAVNPAAAFWGTALRGGGTLTLIAQVGLAALVALQLRREDQWRRLTFAMMLAGGLTAAFALAQALGRDPFVYSLRYDGQASSTLSHPSALGAYLLFPAFMALGLFLESRGVDGDRSRWSAVASAVALALIAGALYATRSRGAILALVVGCLFWWLLATLQPRAHEATAEQPVRRLLMHPRAPVGVVVLLATAVVGVLTLAPLEGLRLGVDRPESAMDSSSVRRLLMWETAADAVWSGPLAEPDTDIPSEFRFGTPSRLILGYGPGAAGVVLTGHRTEARAELLARHSDSSHNIVFDLLLTTGFFGLAVAVWMVCALIALVSRALGLAGSRRQIDLLVVLLVGGAAVGFVAPMALTRAYGYRGVGMLTLSGPGLAAGILAGWVAFLAVASRSRPRFAEGKVQPQRRACCLRLHTLAAALVAYYVFAQFGIAGIAANTMAWLFLGAMLASSGRHLSVGRERSAGNAAIAGCLTLLAITTLALGLSGAPSGLDPLPTFSLDALSSRVDRTWIALAATAAVALAVTLAGSLLSAKQLRAEAKSPQGLASRVARAVAVGILLLAPVPVASELVRRIPVSNAVETLEGIVLLGWVAVVVVLVLLALLAWSCSHTPPEARWGGVRRRSVLPTGGAVLAAALAFANPLAWLDANIGLRRGKALVAIHEYDAGLPMHEWALGRWPFDADAWYATSLAHASAAMERPSTEERFETVATRSIETLRRAVELQPWSSLMRAELAGMHVLLAATESSSEQRVTRFDLARRELQIARYLQPSSLRVRDSLTAVLLELAKQRGEN